jgi:hypothetical protein
MKYRTAEQPFAIVMTAETEGEARHLEYLHSRMEMEWVVWDNKLGVKEIAFEMRESRRPKPAVTNPPMRYNSQGQSGCLACSP